MLPTARVLLPVSFTVLVEIYRYFRSGRQLELPQGVAFRLNPIDDQSGHPPSIPSHAPSDLDPEILELIRTLDPAVIEWIRNLDPAFLDEIRKIQELSLKEKEEKEKGKERETQEETEKERESESGSGGGNENGGEVVKEVVEESSTRNHPRRRESKQIMASKDKAMQEEELAGKQDQTESREIFVGDHFVMKVSEDKAKRREELAEKQDQTENKKKVSKDKAKQREELVENQVQTESKKKVSKDKAKQREELAVKQDQTESKKVFKDKAKQRGELAERQGQTKNKDNARQRGELAEKQGQTKNKNVFKDNARQRGELAEKQGQTKNKYCPGRRKREPSVAPALKLNFLGLPIRPGKKDCLHYMRTGTCQYENSCLYNHPDPTPAEESCPQSAYESHGIHSETTEWNHVITLVL